ncbi:putative membrane protein [Wickerhamomyces ciferrii]|uniref:Membrane protein n=1 Tax=Wickerhamomyces ciferrii (strain ATCC 14091 / BCRC 22168 / CBS 111 / JCM 3599 / NBRC 0793 / NRRL Y-1031 F-60-10) TaxID=1206466 RepID=K0KP10_WICCF|nr:uncharacterized protein BN7_2388 [Wickerhamomyces ciferrii]CCH42843.1 putative membrane protein [Wickerhamomyces ciferrii]
MKVNLFILLIGWATSALASYNYTLSKAEFNLQCFPVYPNDQIHINFLNFTTKPEFEDKKISLPFIFYRKKDINIDKVFAGETNIHHICDQPAIERGYCSEKHLGKILYEYKDPEASQGELFSTILTNFGELKNIREIKEAGYYCGNTKSFKAENYKVVITVDDGYKTTLGSRQSYKVGLVKLTVSLINALTFINTWNKWSQSNGSHTPYLIKLLQIYLVLITFNKLFVILPNITVLWDIDFRLEHKDWWNVFDFLSEFAQKVSFRGCLFYLYQYSGNFSFDKIEELESVKVHLFFFIIDIVSIVLDVFYLSDVFEGAIHTSFLILTFIIFIFNQIFYVKSFLRYKKSVKEFKDFNKTDDPKLSQFKWLILSRFFMGYSEAIIGILGVIVVLISRVLLTTSLVLEIFFLDGEEFIYGTYMDIPIDIFLFFIEFYVFNVILTPKNYEKVINYKKNLD